MKKIYVITGGTTVDVAPHFSLSAKAYGTVGREISYCIDNMLLTKDLDNDYKVVLLETEMAKRDELAFVESGRFLAESGIGKLDTNQDMSKLIDYLVAQPDTRCIIMAAAMCDFEPYMLLNDENGDMTYDFGKDQERLSSKGEYELHLKPAEKLIDKIRKERKDIFLVSFKTTAGVGEKETYKRGLLNLKRSSSNLVFANDIKDKINMVITPEEFKYVGKDRRAAIEDLCEMTIDRCQLTFDRTIVREDVGMASISKLTSLRKIPGNFSTVMKYLVDNNAFKPLNGKTSGHFGTHVSGEDYDRISSVRKVDHNNVFEEGMCKIYLTDNGIEVGQRKASVGEHTQQMIYDELGDKAHSIVHFHSPMRDIKELMATAPWADEGHCVAVFGVKTRPQKSYECGSRECGINSASGMTEMQPGIYAVHLEGHGPNIAFSKDVPAEDVINFISKYWNLQDKEGGLL